MLAVPAAMAARALSVDQQALLLCELCTSAQVFPHRTTVPYISLVDNIMH